MHDRCSGCGCIAKGKVSAGVWSSVQCCETFPEQSVNHLSSATVEMLILGPKYCLPVGPPFQCSAVMLFNCKHNNNYYFSLRQNNICSCKCPQLFLPGAGGAFAAMPWWWKRTGLQAHTMGRPRAAHVPAGWPRPVSRYSAIVNILGDGREVSLTVILRGYLYGKYQLEGDEVTNLKKKKLYSRVD